MFVFIIDCGCAGKMPPGYVPYSVNSSIPFNPIATNGEPFPWHKPNLPNNVRPIRYTLTVHPNLTTFDVKGICFIGMCFFFIKLRNFSQDPKCYKRQ